MLYRILFQGGNNSGLGLSAIGFQTEYVVEPYLNWFLNQILLKCSGFYKLFSEKWLKICCATYF